jgi:voltage-gated potassium channel
MKIDKHAWIFGYSKQSKNIANSLIKDGYAVSIVENNEKYYNDALSDGHKKCLHIDITEDDELEKLNIQSNDWILCVMDDEHLNVFLTLSLRANCPLNKIVAISYSIYATQKLKMAGANEVIDIYQVSTNRILSIFNKPIATTLMDNLISSSHEISFREFVISNKSPLNGKVVDDINFDLYHIIFTGMIDKELGDEFIFATSNINNKLDTDDTIICIGKNKYLDKFEKYNNGDKD